MTPPKITAFSNTIQTAFFIGTKTSLIKEMLKISARAEIFCRAEIFWTDKKVLFLKKNMALDKTRFYSQENNLLNDYSAKMALGLFGKTWWRFSSYSIVYRGR